MRNKKLIILLTIVLTLVLVIVTCGATFLVREVDAYSYYENEKMDEYNRLVIDAAGVKKNTSIFFVDEQGIKQKVEKAYPNIGVINVKRGFPDKVTINYVVYEKMYQFQKGDRYYQCYSSGRIGEESGSEANGCFTVKPKQPTSTVIGEYFQGESGSDRQTVQAIIDYLRSKGLIDYQITQFIRFVDLRRDGYVYIRTNAGVSLELHVDGNFTELLDGAFTAYAKTDPAWGNVEQTKGLIRAYTLHGVDNEGKVKVVYTPSASPEDDRIYYVEHYS